MFEEQEKNRIEEEKEKQSIERKEKKRKEKKSGLVFEGEEKKDLVYKTYIKHI